MIRVAAVGDLHVGTDSRDTLRPAFLELPQCADVLLLAGDLTTTPRTAIRCCRAARCPGRRRQRAAVNATLLAGASLRTSSHAPCRKR